MADGAVFVVPAVVPAVVSDMMQEHARESQGKREYEKQA
jgi:hypothetical protein